MSFVSISLVNENYNLVLKSRNFSRFGPSVGEHQSIALKGVRAIDARNSQLEMAQMLQKPVFALPGCQRMNVNTLLCDTLGLADSGADLARSESYCKMPRSAAPGGWNWLPICCTFAR